MVVDDYKDTVFWTQQDCYTYELKAGVKHTICLNPDEIKFIYSSGA